MDLIAQYLSNFAEISVVAKCSDALEAFHFLQHHHIDLIFLEIEMPGLMGTDLVRSLKSPPKVVFTSSCQKYAIEGFELNAVDYLMKPMPFNRFFTAMVKVLDLFKVFNLAISNNSRQLDNTNDSFLYLRVDRRMVKIAVTDIFWVESLKDYIKVVLKDRILMSKQKISVLESLLPEENFIRIHRSFIVSANKIDSYHSFSIDILGKELPIGRNYKSDCQKRLSALTVKLPGRMTSGKLAVNF
jgi:DNA-binding LytR/AlgR family response regulator